MWNIIRERDDITELMQCFGNFEGSCLCDVKYVSGAFVGTVSDHFINDERSLVLTFQRRSLGDVQTVELRFSSLKSFKLEPLGAGMECYLTSAYAKIENGTVFFSTWDDLDTMNADSGVVLVNAGSLMWRDISDVVQYTA